jgi:SAM-dependent methyltransferase
VHSEHVPQEEQTQQDLYFALLAEMDYTKHVGSHDATVGLAELCHLGPDQYVLEVGCGVGVTPCYLAKAYGCRVLGIDITEAMVERARQRARREGVADRVSFRVADVQDLPFDENTFDVTLGESVIAFVPDKRGAVVECMRVTRPGGYVGFTEATWRVNPSSETLSYVASVLGPGAEMLDRVGWEQLVRDAGLADVIAEFRAITVRREARSRLKRMGCRNFLRSMGRLPIAFARPAYRNIIGDALSEPRVFMESWGYGLYVGKKPGSLEGGS